MTADPPDWIAALVRSPAGSMLHPVSFEPGTVIAHHGEQGQHFLVVLTGEASVVEDGDELARVGPGSVLGELSLLTDGPRLGTVTVTEAMEGLIGDRDCFHAALAVPAVRDQFARAAAQRLATHIEPVPAALPDGRTVLLRPLLPSDREQYIEAVENASRQTLVRRFFGGGPPPPAVVDYLLDVDFVRHFAWVVTSPDGLEGMAVGRYIRDRDDPTLAEFAMTVADVHQGQGIGSLLLGVLAVTAIEAGVAVLTAEVLADNGPMRAVLDRFDVEWRRSERGVVETSVPAG